MGWATAISESAAHQQQRDCGREEITKDDARPGGAHGERATQEQSRADGATNGDHAQLPLVELASQTLFFIDGVLVTQWRIRLTVCH